MRTRRECDIDRIARHAIGWVILAAGAGYLFFGNYTAAWPDSLHAPYVSGYGLRRR